MSIRSLCFACVGVASITTGLVAVFASHFLDFTNQLAAAGVSAVVVLICAGYLSRQLQNECSSLTNLISGADLNRQARNRVAEFELIAAAMQISSQKWEKAAAVSRRQAQEFSTMMQALDQRATGLQPDSNHLRSLLAGLGMAMKSQLNQCARLLSESLQHSTKATEQAETQVACLGSAISSLDQCSATLDTTIQNLRQVSDPTGTASLLSEICSSLAGLTTNLEKISAETGRSERRLNGLSEPTKELNATIQSIAELASRTDLLALNASIESLRAGEHGKGFAIVADEVRKMAEQIAEATRELSGILDAIQLTITETCRSVSTGQMQLDSQTSQSRTLQQTLNGAVRSHQADQEQCLQVAAYAQDQKRLLTEASHWLKQTSNSILSVQRLGDSIQTVSKNTAQALSQVSTVANRLAACREPSMGDADWDQLQSGKTWSVNESDQATSPELAIQR